jgi:uracil-DNA glycosylase
MMRETSEKENEYRQAQLEELSSQVHDLTQSPYYDLRLEKGYKPVFGEGNPSASIIFVGEAPVNKKRKAGSHL